MSKVIAAEIKALGFSPEMFSGVDDTTFDDFLDAVIEEQAEILEGRIGSAQYAVATKPTATQVKRAEKALVAAELWRRRIVVKLSQAVGAGEDISAKYEQQARQEATAEADQLVEKITDGVTVDSTGDFAGGVTTSSHYDSDASSA